MIESGVEYRYQWRNVGNQYIAVLTVSLLNLAAGISNGWMTPMIPILMAPDAPLTSGPLTNEQISWISAFFSVGSMGGTALFACITAFIGSKYSTTLIFVPAMAFAFFTYFGNTFADMFMGRIAAGIVIGAAQSSIVIFTSEISNDDIRGKLNSFNQLSRNSGLLMGFVVSSWLGYMYMPVVFVCLSIGFIVVFVFLPNTPQFYLRRQQLQKAESALKYYKGCKGNTRNESIAFAMEFERIKKWAEQEENSQRLQMGDLCNRHAIKGILIVVVVAILVVVSGNIVLNTYAIPVFKHSGSQIDPAESSIQLAIVQIIGCLCTTQLVDILGRKCLIVISMIGSSGGLAAFAFHSHLRSVGVDVSSYEWCPVAAILFVIFMNSTGILPLASLCAVETLPPKIRGFGLAVSLIAMSVVSSISLKTFPIWMETFGLPLTFMIYAVGCIFGAVFVMVFLVEMTGKSIDYTPANVDEK